MRNLILKMHVSIDGFVAGPHGEADWIFKTQDDGVSAWLVDTLRQADVHIMGAHTFHDMAAYWPYTPGPVADAMNEIPKAVFSTKSVAAIRSVNGTTRSLKDAADARAAQRIEPLRVLPESAATWTNARVMRGDLAHEINLLKQTEGKSVLAHGGGTFAQRLTELGLIDEYRLVVHPVALGSGLPLFSAVGGPVNLAFVSSTPFAAGAVANVYRRM